MFRFWVISDIVSSDLCHILSNLRAVKSASKSVKKNLPNVEKGGRDGDGDGDGDGDRVTSSDNSTLADSGHGSKAEYYSRRRHID